MWEAQHKPQFKQLLLVLNLYDHISMFVLSESIFYSPKILSKIQAPSINLII